MAGGDVAEKMGLAPSMDSHKVTTLAEMSKGQLRALTDKAGIELRVKATRGEMIEALEAQ